MMQSVRPVLFAQIARASLAAMSFDRRCTPSAPVAIATSTRELIRSFVFVPRTMCEASRLSRSSSPMVRSRSRNWI